MELRHVGKKIGYNFVLNLLEKVTKTRNDLVAGNSRGLELDSTGGDPKMGTKKCRNKKNGHHFASNMYDFYMNLVLPGRGGSRTLEENQERG